MKIIPFILFSLTFLKVHAAEQTTIILNQAHSAEKVNLNLEKIQPVYGQEPYDTTCVEKIWVRTVSSKTTRWNSTSSRWEEVVIDTPVYENRNYSCTKYRDVIIDRRLVKKDLHEVSIKIRNPEILKDNIPLDIKLDEKGIVITSSFKNQLITAQSSSQLIESRIENGVLIENYKTQIFLDMGANRSLLEKISSIKIENVILNENEIAFEIQNANEVKDQLKIYVSLSAKKRMRFSGFGITFKEGIYVSDISQASGDHLSTTITHDFLNLGEFRSHWSYDINMGLSLIKPDQLINADQFKDLFGMEIKSSTQEIKPQ